MKNIYYLYEFPVWNEENNITTDEQDKIWFKVLDGNRDQVV